MTEEDVNSAGLGASRGRLKTLVFAVLRPTAQTPLHYERPTRVSVGRYHLRTTSSSLAQG